MRRYVITNAVAPKTGHHIYDVHDKSWLYKNQPSGETWCKHLEYAYTFSTFAEAQEMLTELENKFIETVEKAAKRTYITTAEIIGWGIAAFCIIAIAILFIK